VPSVGGKWLERLSVMRADIHHDAMAEPSQGGMHDSHFVEV
jgi:hypothetical protein